MVRSVVLDHAAPDRGGGRLVAVCDCDVAARFRVAPERISNVSGGVTVVPEERRCVQHWRTDTRDGGLDPRGLVAARLRGRGRRRQRRAENPHLPGLENVPERLVATVFHAAPGTTNQVEINRRAGRSEHGLAQGEYVLRRSAG